MAELSGVRVLVTRPRQQAGELVRRIEQAGGEAIVFPVLEIQSLQDSPVLQQRLAALADDTLAIFISANAVEHGLAAVDAAGQSLAHLRIAAVGRATAEALQAAGMSVQLVPDDACTSEALLALPELQSMRGERVLIFRGEGGRELLADTLRARGAAVDYAECYRRALPTPADGVGLNRRGRRGAIDVITITSNQGLQNLLELAGPEGRDWLFATPLIVISQRAVELARRLGFKQPPVVTTQVSDAALVESLILWNRHRQGHSPRESL